MYVCDVLCFVGDDDNAVDDDDDGYISFAVSTYSTLKDGALAFVKASPKEYTVAVVTM